MTNDDPIEFLRQTVTAGEHWYLALLKTMARWDKPEEVIGDRRYRYLVGGEAFDWLLLAERLVETMGNEVTAPERDALLFHGHPPLDIDDDEFQALIGTPKYQAYLNYLYGVVVEEALQYAVEEEQAKERQGHVWSSAAREGESMYERIYGRGLEELRDEFQRERGLAQTESIDYADLKEFTYWLFKYRVRNGEGARVASDTRKGLAALSRLENAYRKRKEPEAPTQDIKTARAEGERERRARRRRDLAAGRID